MLKTIVIFIIALLGFGMIRLPLQNHIHSLYPGIQE